MIDFLMEAYRGWLDPWALTVRATALLGVATLLNWLLRNRAANTRHQVWSLSFTVLLILPFLGGIFALGGWTAQQEPAAGAMSAAASYWQAVPGGTGVASGRWISDTVLLSELAFLLWIAGSLAGLFSLVIGWLRFTNWQRQGDPIDEGEWQRDSVRLCSRMGIQQPVRLIRSRHIDTPMVGGLWRPAVLLPQAAMDWSRDRRIAVLTHELLHVRRHDPLRQLIGSLALALFWFHPFGWWARKLAISSREQACDEAVLQLGARPSEYARHLFDLATASHRQPKVPSLSMIQRSQLEVRISAILAPQRPGISRGAAFFLGLVLVGQGIAAALTMPPVDPARAGCMLNPASRAAGPPVTTRLPRSRSPLPLYDSSDENLLRDSVGPLLLDGRGS